MKSFLKPTLASILVVTFLSAAPDTQAADTNSAKKAEHAKPAAPALEHRAKPYNGTISAVDKSAMTITLKKKEAEKTFTVTSSTKIIKAGKPATFEDAVVGEDSGISYVDVEGGKAEARSIRLGAKPVKPEAAEKKADKSDKKPKKEKKEKSTDEAKPAEQQ